MTSHRFNLGIIGVLAILALFPSIARAGTRPNFIFIFIDDMGYGDLGCYGNAAVRTPNIDRLAAEGIRFTQFYVNAPICSPSRVAVTTGQYPQRYRITSYIDARRDNEKRGMAQWLPTTAPSLARILSASGYRTAHFGKWHMGGGRDVGESPVVRDYGFDESLTQFEGLGDRILPTFDTLFQNQPHHAHPLAVASAKLGRGDVQYVKRYEVTGRFVERSIQFIRAARDARQPFYINLWPDDVHTPCEPSPKSRGDGSPAAMYRGVINELDQQLAPILDLVRNDPQLRQNTIIILASDNGHDPVVPGAAGLRGHKGNLYEAGIREPLIVWYPSSQPAAAIGTTNDTTVIAGFDLPPTVLKLAGAQTPPDASFDGQDVSRSFAGDAAPRTTPIFWSRPPDRPGPADNSFPDFAVRSRQWKLLIEENGDRPELYDITADPRETHNLAPADPDIVADLSAKLDSWRKQIP